MPRFNRTAKLWEKNQSSFEQLATLEGHTHAVWKAVFSTDDKLIASSGYNGEIIIWNVEKQRPQLTPIRAHTSQIAGLAFSKEGTRLVSASDDRSIKIWDVASGIELFVLRDQGDSQIVHVSFSKDGSKLVSGNAEGWVTIRAVSDEHANARPFLPQNAEEFSFLGEQISTSPNASVEELNLELKNAEKCCRYFPSNKAYGNLGFAQYRLGKLADAIKSLTEADRLEPIHNGHPDERPYIEAFLAMALLRTGDNLAKANQLRSEFETKRKENWPKDDRITALANEVDRVFAAAK